MDHLGAFRRAPLLRTPACLNCGKTGHKQRPVRILILRLESPKPRQKAAPADTGDAANPWTVPSEGSLLVYAMILKMKNRMTRIWKGASLAGTVETQDRRTTGQCLGPCMYEWLHPLTVRMWKVREILKLFQCIGRTRKGLITRQASPQQMNARQCK